MKRCFEVGAASTSEQVMEPSHAHRVRIKDSQCNIQTRNSFTRLIPYVYKEDGLDHLDDGTGLPLEEELHEHGEHIEESDVYVEDPVSLLISGRQKKKEAKILHSGSQPKGRYRA